MHLSGKICFPSGECSLLLRPQVTDSPSHCAHQHFFLRARVFFFFSWYLFQRPILFKEKFFKKTLLKISAFILV